MEKALEVHKEKKQMSINCIYNAVAMLMLLHINAEIGVTPCKTNITVEIMNTVYMSHGIA